MTNYNQILNLIAILSLSFREICGQPLAKHKDIMSYRRTETTQCQNETNALIDGGVDTPTSFIEGIGANIPDHCGGSLADGLKCNFSKKDTSKSCKDAGGQHLLMRLNITCDPISAYLENFPFCVGTSCAIDDISEDYKENVLNTIQEVADTITGGFLKLENCQIDVLPNTSGSTGLSNMLMCVVLVAAAPLLLIV